MSWEIKRLVPFLDSLVHHMAKSLYSSTVLFLLFPSLFFNIYSNSLYAECGDYVQHFSLRFPFSNHLSLEQRYQLINRWKHRFSETDPHRIMDHFGDVSEDLNFRNFNLHDFQRGLYEFAIQHPEKLEYLLNESVFYSPCQGPNCGRHSSSDRSKNFSHENHPKIDQRVLEDLPVVLYLLWIENSESALRFSKDAFQSGSQSGNDFVLFRNSEKKSKLPCHGPMCQERSPEPLAPNSPVRSVISVNSLSDLLASAHIDLLFRGLLAWRFHLQNDQLNLSRFNLRIERPPRFSNHTSI